MFYTSLKEQGSDQARLLKLGLEKYQVCLLTSDICAEQLTFTENADGSSQDAVHRC